MIRPGRPDDAVAIAAIWNAIIRDTLIIFTTEEKSPDALAVQLAASPEAWPYFVAEEDGQVLGFATFGPFRSGPGYARTAEHTIHLAPEARGRGLGKALMEQVFLAARARGVHVLVAGVSSANPAGGAFHEGLGFTQTGILPEVGWKSGRYLDLHLWQKRLD